jgi:hypothetical protein
MSAHQAMELSGRLADAANTLAHMEAIEDLAVALIMKDGAIHVFLAKETLEKPTEKQKGRILDFVKAREEQMAKLPNGGLRE